jgi:hypothetical protein
VRSHSVEAPVDGIHIIKDIQRKLCLVPKEIMLARLGVHDSDSPFEDLFMHEDDGAVLLAPTIRVDPFAAMHYDLLEPRVAYKLPMTPLAPRRVGEISPTTDGRVQLFPAYTGNIGVTVNVMANVKLRWYPTLEYVIGPADLTEHEGMGVYKLAASMFLANYFMEIKKQEQ